MKENNWENIKHNTFYGSNTVLGSPRGWYLRATGLNQPDPNTHETSLDSRKLTVAGIWRRPTPLPDTGSWPALYRFFQLTDNIRKISRAKPEEFYSVIGMAVAVPADHIFRVYQEFRQTADWVWVHWPTGENQTTPKRSIKELDHAHLYTLFEQGRTAKQVSADLDISLQSVVYVYQKWQDGRPPTRRQRSRDINHNQVLEDIRLGDSIAEIARRYDISRTMVYKVKQKSAEK